MIDEDDLDISILPGAGSIELYIAHQLRIKSLEFENESREIYQSVADSFEIIPKLLIQNTGNNISKLLPSLKKQISEGEFLGIDKSGEFFDPSVNMINDPFILKKEIYQTALECCLSLLKVDCLIREKTLQ